MEGTTLIEAEILGVSEKHRTRKSDGQPFTMYEIQIEGGHIYSTTFVEAANEAFALVGKKAKLGVKVVQNGQYINRYLQKVYGEVFTEPGFVEQQPENRSGFAGANLAPPPPSNGSVTSHTADPVEEANKYEAERQERIMRQTAAKVAAMLFASGDSQLDFFDNCDQLVKYFATGSKPLSVELAQESR